MIALVWLLACSTPENPSVPPPAPTEAPAAHAHADSEPHDHAMTGGDAHSSHADHMKAMGAQRDALRAQLGASYDEPVPGLDAADQVAGKALYDAQCAACHGAAGKGDGAAGEGLNPSPADFTDAFHARFYSDAGRIHIIRNGSPGTAMAAFGQSLDDKQIVDLYAYVRQFRAASDPVKTP